MAIFRSVENNGRRADAVCALDYYTHTRAYAHGGRSQLELY